MTNQREKTTQNRATKAYENILYFHLGEYLPLGFTLPGKMSAQGYKRAIKRNFRWPSFPLLIKLPPPAFRSNRWYT